VANPTIVSNGIDSVQTACLQIVDNDSEHRCYPECLSYSFERYMEEQSQVLTDEV
jgi:hypothetical protein